MNFLRIFGKNTLIVKMTKKAVSKEMEKHQNLENLSWRQLRQELGGPVTLPHEKPIRQCIRAFRSFLPAQNPVNRFWATYAASW